MHRVLVLSDLCLASPRIPGLVKYLPPTGWMPVVFAPPLPRKAELLFGPNSDFHALDIPRIHAGSPRVLFHAATADSPWRRRLETRPRLAAFLRYLYLRQMEVGAYPDEYRSWSREVMPAALRALEEHKIDVVLSSSSPVSMHVLASRLHEATGIPWVADFRDLWTQNYNYPFSPIRRRIERRLELRTVQSAASLVSVSDACCRELGRIHKQPIIASISNGYDPQYATTPAPAPAPPFRILYTGTVYRGKQDPTVFLDALSAILGRGVIDRARIAVDFHGRAYDWFQSEIESRGLQDVVRQQGMLPREDVFRRQHEAHVLLVFAWEADDDKGVVPLKTFEYLAAGRTILATGGRVVDALSDILERTQAGFSCRTPDEAASVLERIIRQWQADGTLPWAGLPDRIADYAYPRMAAKFADVFNRVRASS